jgi:RNA processing factor Prp31
MINLKILNLLIFIFIIFLILFPQQIMNLNIDKDIDIFNKKYSKFFDYLMDNLVNQITKKSEFFSIIDCLESYEDIEQKKINLLNFCIVENKEGKSIPFFLPFKNI